MKPTTISYSFGGGGRWLSHLLWCLENNLSSFQNINGAKNYHQGNYSTYFSISHYDDKIFDYLFSSDCKFNFFLNSWVKLWAADNYCGFNQFSLGQQIFTLSNEVCWRLSDDYTNAYEKNVDIDYANIIKDTNKFRTQLISIVSLSWPQESIDNATQIFIDKAIFDFKKTIVDTNLHLGNVDSIGWLGWCHGMCLTNNITIPVSVIDDINGYRKWLTENQSWIIEKTTPYIL